MRRAVEEILGSGKSSDTAEHVPCAADSPLVHSLARGHHLEVDFCFTWGILGGDQGLSVLPRSTSQDSFDCPGNSVLLSDFQ